MLNYVRIVGHQRLVNWPIEEDDDDYSQLESPYRINIWTDHYQQLHIVDVNSNGRGRYIWWPQQIGGGRSESLQ